MNTRLMKFTSLAAAASLLLSSCADTQDGRVTQAQGAGTGAAAGAIFGALLGAATGNYSSIGQAALIGAGVGAVGGFVYGTEVAKKKASYAKQEDFLNYAIAQAEQSNAEAVASNQKLLAEVSSLEGRYHACAATDKKGLAKVDKDAKVQLAAIQKQDTKLDAQIKDYNECLNGDGYGDKTESKALRAKIKSLEEQKSALQQYQRRLASAQTRIAI